MTLTRILLSWIINILVERSIQFYHIHKFFPWMIYDGRILECSQKSTHQYMWRPKWMYINWLSKTLYRILFYFVNMPWLMFNAQYLQELQSNIGWIGKSLINESSLLVLFSDFLKNLKNIERVNENFCK